jgi:predicted metal-dependent hydrolase
MTRWRSKDEFKNRVRHWAGKLDVSARAIYMRPMSRKWASCSTGGNLNFNLELLAIERELGDYVIVHELLHFSVPNHGQLWKMRMRAHLGDYERLAERLPKVARSARSVVKRATKGPNGLVEVSRRATR